MHNTIPNSYQFGIDKVALLVIDRCVQPNRGKDSRKHSKREVRLRADCILIVRNTSSLRSIFTNQTNNLSVQLGVPGIECNRKIRSQGETGNFRTQLLSGQTLRCEVAKIVVSGLLHEALPVRVQECYAPSQQSRLHYPGRFGRYSMKRGKLGPAPDEISIYTIE